MLKVLKNDNNFFIMRNNFPFENIKNSGVDYFRPPSYTVNNNNIKLGNKKPNLLST